MRMALRCFGDAVGIVVGLFWMWEVWLNGWFAGDCLCCGGPIFVFPRSLSAWTVGWAAAGLALFGWRFWALGRRGRYGAWVRWPYAVVLVGLACAPLAVVYTALWSVLLNWCPETLMDDMKTRMRFWGWLWALVLGVPAAAWLFFFGRRSRLGWVALAFAAWMGCFGVPDVAAAERWLARHVWHYGTVGAVTNGRVGEIADAPGLSPWGGVSG